MCRAVAHEEVRHPLTLASGSSRRDPQGVLVPVRVTKHSKYGVRVRLEGGPGLFGYVPADYVTDDVLPSDPITGQVPSARDRCPWRWRNTRGW